VDDPLMQRCSGFARAQDLDPAGTAGSYRGYVALDVPLPWPHEITEHPEVAPAAAALAQAGVRLQGVVPDPGRSPDRRRLLTFLRPAGPFAGYRTVEWSVAAADVTSALSALAAAAAAGPVAADPAALTSACRGERRQIGETTAGDDSAGDHGREATAGDRSDGGDGGEATAGPAVRVADGHEAGRHVLVCTHGKRDACCGSLGTRLATALPGLGAGVRVWRTSHTGGHRFAPTAVLLPEGTAWAYLDLDTLVGISDRTLDLDDAVRRYRGCTGLEGPEVQAAEREALRTVGWAWLDHRRSGAVVARDGGRTRVRLDGVAPDGARTSFEATVEVARLVPVPDCGKPLSEARKSSPELRVSDFAAA
jgi:hypothetical protein